MAVEQTNLRRKLSASIRSFNLSSKIILFALLLAWPLIGIGVASSTNPTLLLASILFLIVPLSVFAFGLSTKSQPALPSIEKHVSDNPSLSSTFAYLLAYYSFLFLLSRSSTLHIPAIILTILIGLLLLVFDVQRFFGLFIAFLLTFRTVIWYFRLPVQFEWVPMFLSCASLVSVLRNQERVKASRDITLVIGGFFAFFLIFFTSALLNATNVTQLVVPFAWAFYGPLLFLSVYFHRELTVETLIGYVDIILIVFALQLPLQFLQVLGIPGMAKILPHPDFYSGTFGLRGTIRLSVFLLAVIYGALIYGITHRFTLKLMTVIGVALSSSFLASAEFTMLGTLLFPFIFLPILFFAGISGIKGRLRRYVLLALVLVPILVFSLQYYGSQYILPNSARGFRGLQLFDVGKFMRYTHKEYRSERTGEIIVGRLLGLELATEKISASPLPNLLVGFGPDSTRMTESSLGVGAYRRLVYYASFFGFDSLMLEYGVLGASLNLSILAYIGGTVYGFVRKTSDNEYKLYGLVYLGIFVVFMLTAQYDGGWFEPYQKVILFWVGTAGILKLKQRVGSQRLVDRHILGRHI